jgi:thymidine phosphorylase
MNIVRLISKKRDGEELADFEIGALIDAYVKGDVPTPVRHAICAYPV